MAATAASPRDWHKIQTFAVKVLSDIIAQQIGPLSIVADRLSLFTTLAQPGLSKPG